MAIYFGNNKLGSLGFGGNSFSSAFIGNDKVWSKESVRRNLVGGTIYCIGADNGATYTFYDANGNVITDQTVSGLANAYGYTKSGESTADKFYVYNSNISDTMEWGGYPTEQGVTATAIGSGKSNSATCLASLGDTSGCIWYWLKNTLNANSSGCCNDWYIPSKEESEALRNADLDSIHKAEVANWFSSYYMWSSSEGAYFPCYNVWTWACNDGGSWYNGTKSNSSYNRAFGVRSF